MPVAPRAANAWLSEAHRLRRSVSDLLPDPSSVGACRAHSCANTVVARLVRSVDFERVLRTRNRGKSVHFAVHYVADRPYATSPASKSLESGKLSTDAKSAKAGPVDDLTFSAPASVAKGLWLGAVVPKRHARRAVTRTILKRQIRSVVAIHAQTLAAGLWVVRLRAPFDRKQFVSAASDELKRVARDELEQLMRDAAVSC
jgi:ribonuclease P protein component